jgi:hypothetical protein
MSDTDEVKPVAEPAPESPILDAIGETGDTYQFQRQGDAVMWRHPKLWGGAWFDTDDVKLAELTDAELEAILTLRKAAHV